MTDSIEGSINHETELKITINFHEIRDRKYFEVYLLGDTNGVCNIAPYLTKDERNHIDDCVNDKLYEMKREMANE